MASATSTLALTTYISPSTIRVRVRVGVRVRVPPMNRPHRMRVPMTTRKYFRP